MNFQIKINWKYILCIVKTSDIGNKNCIHIPLRIGLYFVNTSNRTTVSVPEAITTTVYTQFRK